MAGDGRGEARAVSEKPDPAGIVIGQGIARACDRLCRGRLRCPCSDGYKTVVDALTEAGYVIVPAEPTIEMQIAGNGSEQFYRNESPVSADVWGLMVGARPR